MMVCILLFSSFLYFSLLFSSLLFYFLLFFSFLFSSFLLFFSLLFSFLFSSFLFSSLVCPPPHPTVTHSFSLDTFLLCQDPERTRWHRVLYCVYSCASETGRTGRCWNSRLAAGPGTVFPLLSQEWVINTLERQKLCLAAFPYQRKQLNIP